MLRDSCICMLERGVAGRDCTSTVSRVVVVSEEAGDGSHVSSSNY